MLTIYVYSPLKIFFPINKLIAKKINEIILLLNEIDSDATVVFQSDHGFLLNKDHNSRDKKSFEIFNIIKTNTNCKIDQNIKIGNIESIRFIIACMFGKNYYSVESKEYYVKERSKKIGTVLDELN